MDDELIARRILRVLRLPAARPKFGIKAGRFVLNVIWDGAARSNGKFVLVEVEPDHPSEPHIRLHVTNLALLACQRHDIDRLLWVVTSTAPHCQVTLRSYAEPWAAALGDAVGRGLPPMEYFNRDGTRLG